MLAKGLDILDDKGRLVAGALETLNQILGITIERLTTFDPTSFTEQFNAAILGARLQGTPIDAATEFQLAVQSIGGDFKTTVDDLFKGIDFSDPASIQKIVNDVFDKLFKGEITADQFGDLSRDDLIQILNLGADALENFTESVDAATKSTLNLPSGFKLAAAEFFARDAFTPAIPTLGPRLDILVNAKRGTDGAALPVAGETVVNVTFQPGSIVAAPGQSPEEIAEATVAEIRRRAMSQTGNTLQFPFT